MFPVKRWDGLQEALPSSYLLDPSPPPKPPRTPAYAPLPSADDNAETGSGGGKASGSAASGGWGGGVSLVGSGGTNSIGRVVEGANNETAAVIKVGIGIDETTKEKKKKTPGKKYAENDGGSGRHDHVEARPVVSAATTAERANVAHVGSDAADVASPVARGQEAAEGAKGRKKRKNREMRQGDDPHATLGNVARVTDSEMREDATGGRGEGLGFAGEAAEGFSDVRGKPIGETAGGSGKEKKRKRARVDAGSNAAVQSGADGAGGVPGFDEEQQESAEGRAAEGGDVAGGGRGAGEGAGGQGRKGAAAEGGGGAGKGGRKGTEGGGGGGGGGVLPWMRAPVKCTTADAVPLASVPNLDKRLLHALTPGGISHLFPVQATVWRELLSGLPGAGGGGSGGSRGKGTSVGAGDGRIGGKKGGGGRAAEWEGGEEREGGEEWEVQGLRAASHDLCVCAPTGSGKTLAYALPVVQALAGRVVRRVRALIVLPTRDLAAQVKHVFDTIAPAVGLSVALINGQSSLADEAALLVRRVPPPSGPLGLLSGSSSFGYSSGGSGEGGCSLADIVVATPGRLVDHLRGTEGFSLAHLRFLVVDEADRLLRQSYHDWLPLTLSAAAAATSATTAMHADVAMTSVPHMGSRDTVIHGAMRFGAAATLPHPFIHGLRSNPSPFSLLSTPNIERHRVIKIVCSATLTRDPSKIQRLRLHRPLFISSPGHLLASAMLRHVAAGGTRHSGATADVDSGDVAVVEEERVVEGDEGVEEEGEEEGGLKHYSLPPQLATFMLLCTRPSDKPLLLAALLKRLTGGNGVGDGMEDAATATAAPTSTAVAAGGAAAAATTPTSAGLTLVFASSLQAAHRLFLLLSAFPPAALPFAFAEYSSRQPQRQRSAVLDKFRRGEVQVLVASDAMTRGMDVEGIANVVSYDAPVYPKTFVHRAGRTARAGRLGSCYTIVRKQEVRHFKAVLAKTGCADCAKAKAPSELMEQLRDHYDAALERLKEVVGEEERRGK